MFYRKIFNAISARKYEKRAKDQGQNSWNLHQTDHFPRPTPKKTPKSLKFLCMEIWAGKNLFLCLIVQANTCRSACTRRYDQRTFRRTNRTFFTPFKGGKGRQKISLHTFPASFLRHLLCAGKSRNICLNCGGRKKRENSICTSLLRATLPIYRTHITSHKKEAAKKARFPLFAGPEIGAAEIERVHFISV